MPRSQVGRIIGLDVGERRIGVAISTPEGGLAVPFRIIDRQKEPDDLAAIFAIATSEDAESFVVGYPLSLDGSAGRQARQIEGFARRLRKLADIPVELWDERLTSVQAQRSVAGGKRGPVDDIAAAIILQGYLDRKRAAASG